MGSADEEEVLLTADEAGEVDEETEGDLKYVAFGYGALGCHEEGDDVLDFKEVVFV